MDFEPFHLFFHERFLDHVPADGMEEVSRAPGKSQERPAEVLHPEAPARLVNILERLREGPLAKSIHWQEPRAIAIQELRRFHDDGYIMRFEEACLAGKSFLGHPDNQICYESFATAMLAAGAAINAVDLVENGEPVKAFCALRPPGHHAEAGMALGFCFFNNAVLAARHWQERYGRRVAVIDFDAHHGNGIQAAAETFDNIFYVSFHEHPTFSFPGTGYAEESVLDGNGGWILDLPLLPGTGDGMVLETMTEKVLPALDRYAPDAIVVAAGFDGHLLDDMSGLAYTTDLYGHLGAVIRKMAHRWSGGKVVSVLEGGYHLQALAASVERYLAGLTRRDKKT